MTNRRSMSRRTVVKASLAASVSIGAASSRFWVPTTFGADKKKVLFWTTYSGDSFAYLKKIAEAYTAQSANFAVEIVQRPDEGGDDASLFTAVRGGEGPDAYTLDRFTVAERAGQGMLEDLTPLMEKAGDTVDLHADYVTFAAEEATYNGKPFALPFDTDVRVLYYHVKSLKDLGVDMATIDPKNGTVTWDQFAEWAIACDKKKGNDWESLGFIPDEGQGSLFTWGNAWGGEFFDWKNCQVTPDHENIVKAASFVQTYTKDHDAEKMDAFMSGAEVEGATALDDPFMQVDANGHGRLMSVIGGSWNPASFKEYIPKIEIGAMLLPTGTDTQESSTWAGGWSGIVPKGAKNPEGGYDFIRFLCGEPGQKMWYELNTGLPTFKKLAEDKTLFKNDPMMDMFATQVFPTAKNRPPLPMGGKYWDELKTAWDEIRKVLNTPEEALKTCKENAQTELDAMGLCPLQNPADSK